MGKRTFTIGLNENNSCLVTVKHAGTIQPNLCRSLFQVYSNDSDFSTVYLSLLKPFTRGGLVVYNKSKYKTMVKYNN